MDTFNYTISDLEDDIEFYTQEIEDFSNVEVSVTLPRDLFDHLSKKQNTNTDERFLLPFSGGLAEVEPISDLLTGYAFNPSLTAIEYTPIDKETYEAGKDSMKKTRGLVADYVTSTLQDGTVGYFDRTFLIVASLGNRIIGAPKHIREKPVFKPHQKG